MFIPEASSSAVHVDRAFLTIVLISVVLLVVVTGAMLIFVVRYNRAKKKSADQIEGGTILEIVWTVIPVVLVLIMFVIGERSFRFIRSVPRETMLVRVEARQWSWSFSYGNGVQSDTLRVPAGRPVKLLLTSKDVLHSFYIPAFRIKEDCVPGMETYLSFTATATGTYDIFCTEYCGLGHSDMLAKTVVMPPQEFDAWYSGPQAAGGRGEQLLTAKGCLGCHSVDGTRKIGPSLKGVFGRQVTVLTEGNERTVNADEAYLRRSILDPKADIVKGYPPVMPAIPLAADELDEIIHYLEALK